MSYPTKGRADYLELGDYNAVCYQCGRKRKAGTLLKHWQGYFVCPEHWEPRQAQDFVRSVPDNQTPPWTQPMPEASFVGQCFPNDSSAYPGWCTPGCVMPDYISPFFDPTMT